MEDQTTQQDMQHSNNKMYLYIVAVVAVVFIVIALTLLKENQKESALQTGNNNTQAQPTGGATSPSTQGSMTMATADGGNRYATGSAVVVQVVGNSAGQEVVGYDALVKYDPASFDYVSSRSLLKEFTVFGRDQKESGVVSVTASKLPQATSSTSFAAGVLELTFTPKKAGSYTFSVLDQSGRETTKFVNDQTAVLKPSLGSVTVEIY